jgi:hypothetical protein
MHWRGRLQICVAVSPDALRAAMRGATRRRVPCGRGFAFAGCAFCARDSAHAFNIGDALARV